jgi:hypothetical protein
MREQPPSPNRCKAASRLALAKVVGDTSTIRVAAAAHGQNDGQPGPPPSESPCASIAVDTAQRGHPPEAEVRPALFRRGGWDKEPPRRDDAGVYSRRE